MLCCWWTRYTTRCLSEPCSSGQGDYISLYIRMSPGATHAGVLASASKRIYWGMKGSLRQSCLPLHEYEWTQELKQKVEYWLPVSDPHSNFSGILKQQEVLVWFWWKMLGILCPHSLMCGCVWWGVHACVCIRVQDWGQHVSSLVSLHLLVHVFRDRASQGTWNSQTKLDCLASKPQRSFYLCLPSPEPWNTYSGISGILYGS